MREEAESRKETAGKLTRGEMFRVISFICAFACILIGMRIERPFDLWLVIGACAISMMNLFIDWTTPVR
jgi:hypothetical protein